MRIGGYQKTSLIDYPEKIAAVIFTSGCNFRCPYCHNRDLVLARPEDGFFEAAEVLRDLGERRKLLDGVVITGGEPTLQEDLLPFARKVKDLDLLVKLDTNGSNSSILSSMKENGLVDFVALDVKAPLDDRYKRSAGLPWRGYPLIGVTPQKAVMASLRVLRSSGIDYELRTTVVPTLHSEKDLLDLAKQLKKILNSQFSTLNSPFWFLQNFQPKNCLDPEFEKVRPYDKMFLERLVEKLKIYMPKVSLRS